MIDTNVTLHPEKTKLDFDVHPMYRMNLHDIYHVGYFTIEKKTFIDFDFKISEYDTIVSIDFSGEILQKFINDISEPYEIPKYGTPVFSSRGPRFENPTPAFGFGHSHQDQNTLISGYRIFKSKRQ